MENSFKNSLKTNFIGQNIIILDELDSTNNYAKELLTSNPPFGTVIIAHKQTSGRGQFDRNWYSPTGGLYYSCIVKADVTDRLSFFTLTAGLACCEAIRNLTSLNTSLKWVNDIEYEGKKLGGILSESRIRGFSTHLIVGIGININLTPDEIPEELKEQITSLNQETGKDINKFELAAYISNSLEKYINLFDENQFKMIKSLWIKNSNTIGRKVKFKVKEVEEEGIIIDISNSGELEIQSLRGKQYYLSNNLGLTYIS